MVYDIGLTTDGSLPRRAQRAWCSRAHGQFPQRTEHKDCREFQNPIGSAGGFFCTPNMAMKK